MAASSKVNASVEQANVSSGWDEARAEVSTSAPVEMKKKSPSNVHVPQLGATSFQTSLQFMERRVRNYLAQGKDECQKMAKTVGRQMRWLKEEHPGSIVVAAAVAGFGCGLLLRTKQSRRRLNFYE
jgi:hypothetical protein